MSNVEKFVVKFDYNIEVLQGIVNEANKIDLTNIELVKETHKKLVKIRTTIKKQEKEMVDEANSFRSRVFEKRDEYLAITEPVETKLKTTLDLEEERKITEARVALLSNKKEQLVLLDVTPVKDEEILAMDDEQWVTFFLSKMAEHHSNVATKAKLKKEMEERIEREARIKKELEEKAEKEKKEIIERAEREKKELAERVEKEKQQAILKAENDKRLALEKAERDQKEAIEKIEREAKAKIEKEKKDKETKERVEAETNVRLEANKKYQQFLKDNNYDENMDYLLNKENKVILMRKVAEFIK